MVKAIDYNYIKYHHKKIRLTMKDGTVDTGIYLGYDSVHDNDEGDGFILDVDGDVYSGRLVLEKDVEKVEFLD